MKMGEMVRTGGFKPQYTSLFLHHFFYFLVIMWREMWNEMWLNVLTVFIPTQKGGGIA
jgi:hypothetical protein